MGGYIRLDKDQVEDQRLFDLADRLARDWQVVATGGQPNHDLSRNDNCHVLRNALLGGLATLWAYADRYVLSDNSLRVTLSGLASIVGLPVTWLEKLPEKWLRVRADGYVELPGYCEKNSITARDLRRQDKVEAQDHARELNRLRQQRYREKRRVERNVTLSREKERYSNGVTPPTGTGTGSLRPNPVPRNQSHKTPASPRGQLASAVGRLAGRDAPERAATGSPPLQPARSPEDLRSDALKLAAAGNGTRDVARLLERYGVTPQQVTEWLANAPPGEGQVL